MSRIGDLLKRLTAAKEAGAEYPRYIRQYPSKPRTVRAGSKHGRGRVRPRSQAYKRKFHMRRKTEKTARRMQR
jgi:hypothetical protein